MSLPSSISYLASVGTSVPFPTCAIPCSSVILAPGIDLITAWSASSDQAGKPLPNIAKPNAIIIIAFLAFMFDLHRLLARDGAYRIAASGELVGIGMGP